MDSLLASYASSDEEEEQEEGEQQPPPQQQKPQLPPVKPTTFPSSSLFSSLPKPQSSSSSSSLFQSVLEDSRTTPKPPSSVFSALPKPKSQKPTFNFTPSDTRPKRVVQFKPPINPFSLKSIELGEDDGDDEEEENERRRKRDSASKSSSSGPTPWTDLVSAVPAPKSSASLGVLPSAGSGRRAIVETEVPVSNSADLRPDNDDSSATGQDNSATYQSAFEQNVVNYAEYYSYANYESGNDQNAVNYGYHESYNSGVDQSGNGSSDGGYGGYGDYGEYGQQYGNNWAEGSAATSAAAVLEVPGAGQSGFGVKRKRGRSEIPAEIVEVKQDELIKNRPREDQAKLTGIAFGPSYRPVSTKGKPSKLHKRKHQIGALYYDMKQKEMELAERRAKGFLTKSETQAKYGW